MEVIKAIKSRRSIRNFSSKKLEDGVLEKIIEAGTYAPSHCNTQGWKFIFVDDNNTKKKMFNSGGSFVINNAPYGLLVLYNIGTSDNSEYLDWIQSSSAAIQNILLRIHDLGLGGCWVCHLPSKQTLAKLFNIKKPYSPVAYIAFGYPEQIPSPMPRKNKTNDFLGINEFIWPEEKIPFKITYKKLLKKIYFKLPGFVKIIINPFTDKFVKKFYN